MATAIVVSFGNIAGVVSSYTYPLPDRPKFTKGHAINMAYTIMGAVVALSLTFYLRTKNAQKAKRNAGKAWTQEDKMALKDDGDYADFFLYAY